MTADTLSAACVNCVTGRQIQSVQGTQISSPIPVAVVPAGSQSNTERKAAHAARNFLFQLQNRRLIR